MSRQRIMGTNGGPLAGVLTSPGYALIAQQGVASTTVQPSLEFPLFFDAAELCEFWGKNIEITVDFSLALSGNDGTDDWLFTRQCSDILILRPEESEEAMRDANLTATPSEWFTRGAFIGVTNDRRNGVDNFGTVDFNPQLLMSYFVSSAGTPSNQSASDGTPSYFYRTDTQRWLPRLTAEIEIELLPLLGAGQLVISSRPLTPGPGQGTSAAIGATFNGRPFDCQITKPTWATVTAFQFALRYSGFLPYIGASGAIWDTKTGRELRSHSTTAD